MPLAGLVDDAQRDAVHVDGIGRLHRADDERRQVSTSASCPRTGSDPAVAVVALHLGAVGDREERLVDHERRAEHGLQVGLVPAGEGAARVGGLELRGGDRARAAVLALRRWSGRSRASGPRAARRTRGAGSTPPAPPSPAEPAWARSASSSSTDLGDRDAGGARRAIRRRSRARRRSGRSRSRARGPRPARPRFPRTSRPRGPAPGRGRSGAGGRYGAGGSGLPRQIRSIVTSSVVHVGEPAGVLLDLALRRREERPLELLRDRPPMPLADDPVVDLADRRDLGGRPRKKTSSAL